MFTSVLNFNDRSLNKLNRSLLNKKTAIAPLKSITGYKIYDTESKLKLFANTMEEQFTTNPEAELPVVRFSVEELNKYRYIQINFLHYPKESMGNN